MRILRPIVVIATILLTALLAACGGGGGAVGDTTPISVRIAADRSAALADGADAITFTATVTDETGTPLQGKDVTFSVVTPRRTTASSSTTDGNGQALFTLQRTAEQVALYGEIVKVMAIYGNGVSSKEVTFTAGPIVEIVDNGGGTFTLMGRGLVNIAGMELSLGYETTVLANPRVEWGDLVSNTLNVTGAPASGSIGLAWVSTTGLSGSGKIATFHFDQIATTGRKINGLGGSVITTSGDHVAATFVMPPSTTTSSAGSNSGSGT